jgi:hypothetical protein
MKPSRNNSPSSDTIYQGTVIIPYVKGFSEKFRRTGNSPNVRTIFKTKHAFRGTLVKNGPVRDAHVTVPDVTSAKQPDIYKYVLRGTNIT